MQGLNDFQIWHHRREESFRKAEMNRLARTAQPGRKKAGWIAALGWELQSAG